MKKDGSNMYQSIQIIHLIYKNIKYTKFRMKVIPIDTNIFNKTTHL